VRYGGEEFALILPDSELEGVRIITEKLRVAVSDLNMPHSESKVAGCITVSVGVTAESIGNFIGSVR